MLCVARVGVIKLVRTFVGVLYVVVTSPFAELWVVRHTYVGRVVVKTARSIFVSGR
jgi:hypothetical protein